MKRQEGMRMGQSDYFCWEQGTGKPGALQLVTRRLSQFVRRLVRGLGKSRWTNWKGRVLASGEKTSERPQRQKWKCWDILRNEKQHQTETEYKHPEKPGEYLQHQAETEYKRPPVLCEQAWGGLWSRQWDVQKWCNKTIFNEPTWYAACLWLRGFFSFTFTSALKYLF